MPTIVDIPLYEPIILGFPFYMILIGMLGLILIFGMMLFKLEVYDRLDPVWGHRAASFKNIPEAIVHGASGKLSLLPVEEVAGIFSAMGLPLKWIQTARTQGQLGKVNVIEVSDDWNIVTDVNIDYAIVEAVHTWNEVNPEGTPEHIYNYETFEKHMMNGDLDEMFPKGIKLPPFRIVDLHEIRRYLPKWTASHHAGYITEEINKRKSEDDTKGLGLLKYAIIAGGIIVICAVFAYVILTAIH